MSYKYCKLFSSFIRSRFTSKRKKTTWRLRHLVAAHEKAVGGQPHHRHLPLRPLCRRSTSSHRRRSSLSGNDSEIVLLLQNAGNENCSGSTSWTRRSTTWRARTWSWLMWSSDSRTLYAISSKKFLNTWKTVVKLALWKKLILLRHENATCFNYNQACISIFKKNSSCFPPKKKTKNNWKTVLFSTRTPIYK